ncbi:MAG: hypothetical protein HY601_03155 [Candidatus Omnitrophica bacterium]|nr:hypothetical protein [Candidatus Omnitrophota bacterium]
MGIHNRPVTCAATSKRLRMKTWFYRNGKYYYNRRAWQDEQAKAASEAAKPKPEAAPAEGEAGEAKTK